MALEVRGITKAFGIGNKRSTVLNRFSMTVEDGEMVAIVGKKRSGKSTLMNILGGMSRPDSGTYWVDGKQVHPWNPFAMAMLRSRKFGIITREPLLVQDMTVYENIMMPLSHRLMTNKTKTKRAKDLLRSLGMKGKGKFYPHELTELEQQKVCAARAMITEPKYLLADEPTACLVSSDVDRYLDFLEVLNSAGYTILIATHSKRVASRCHRMIPITGQEPESAEVQPVAAEEMPEVPGHTVAGTAQGPTSEEEAYLRGVESEDTEEELENKIRENLSAMGMAGEIPPQSKAPSHDSTPEREEAEVEMIEVMANTGNLALSSIMEEELEKSLQMNVEHLM